MSGQTTDKYFRKGFGLASDVREELDSDYADAIVDAMRANGDVLQAAGITLRLAKEFGFCYGVERAVDYAYQTRRKFPDKRIFLVGEIIHNPHVNTTLRRMGIEFLVPLEGVRDGEPRFNYTAVGADDVVILPAFGVTMADFQALRDHGCVVVDTTCGSVLNVWKRVDSYARDGLTALIHGKYYHEETRATASQVLKYEGGRYIVVRDMGDAEFVANYVEQLGQSKASDEAAQQLLQRFAHSVSPGFDPSVDLCRIGVANQTTMLARESLAIGELVGQAMERGFGTDYRAQNFRTFDTICSATQDRQDAVLALLREPLDAMIVIGGFNSSNTISLAALCAEHVPTYHVEDSTGIDPSARTLYYRPAGVKHSEATAGDWMPESGEVRLGITAGASTPNSKIGDAVARIFATRRVSMQDLLALPGNASVAP